METFVDKAQAILDGLRVFRDSSTRLEPVSEEQLARVDRAIKALEHWLKDPTQPFPQ